LKTLERVKGIEPSYSAWKAAALPLSYTRVGGDMQRIGAIGNGRNPLNFALNTPIRHRISPFREHRNAFISQLMKTQHAAPLMVAAVVSGRWNAPAACAPLFGSTRAPQNLGAPRMADDMPSAEVDSPERDTGWITLEFLRAEFARRPLLNPIAQLEKLLLALPRFGFARSIKIVHGRRADRACDLVHAIHHREPNDHAILVIALKSASGQCHV
jgi:hypothetical protein